MLLEMNRRQKHAGAAGGECSLRDVRDKRGDILELLRNSSLKQLKLWTRDCPEN